MEGFKIDCGGRSSFVVRCLASFLPSFLAPSLLLSVCAFVHFTLSNFRTAHLHDTPSQPLSPGVQQQAHRNYPCLRDPYTVRHQGRHKDANYTLTSSAIQQSRPQPLHAHEASQGKAWRRLLRYRDSDHKVTQEVILDAFTRTTTLHIKGPQRRSRL